MNQRPPTPSPVAWFELLTRLATNWVADQLPDDAPFLRTVLLVAMWTVVGIVLVLVILAAVVVFRSIRRKPVHLSNAGSNYRSIDEPATDPDVRTPESCWRQFEQALTQGNSREATIALWWWLAITVAGEAVEESWTSRDLIRHSGRRQDLAASLACLDAVAYGGTTVDEMTIRSIASQLTDVL
ncbi:MAG: hypothetical protein GY906_27390 [bacterium]|nr:hypothetical protein [bacterium]